MKLPVLPVYYYRDHFLEMLAFVGDIYGSILTDEHRAFMARFDGLSRDAQCLLIRMVNRRGPVFSRAALRYAEISDSDQALDELTACGHLARADEQDYESFVRCLSKDALLEGARAAGFVDVRTSWAKPKIVEFFLASISFATAFEHCDGSDFVVLRNTRPIEFLLYLYFGKTEVNLKSFALRDLGILRTNDASTFSARFSDGDEAGACFHYSQVLDRIEAKLVAACQNAVADILDGPACPTDHAADLRSRAACQLGHFFEKRGDGELAGQLYRAGTSSECHERLVRLLYATGYKASAEEVLRQMIDDPASDDAFTFATDFYARKFGGRRTGLCTELLRAGRTITVDDTHRGNPEAGVAGVMRRQGYQVFFAENTLWQSLFGLLFWDELFEQGQLHSGFDWMPQCLRDRTFARVFAAPIERKLAAIRSGNALPHLLRTVAARWGRPNGVFAWNHLQMDGLRALLEGTAPDGIAAIIRLMCDDFRSNHDGFPDLMLVKAGAVSFMEIKAEGDVIRRNQLTRLRQLANAGIPAEIGRVDYRFDPEQDYVVVDIETTGAWSSGDRITEIGAVKIRNHEVIGEWQTLVNPQRSIPAKIVQLTGITNDMVRGAPVFAEVADHFMDFMSDAIFVAHNVNFDYGFLSYEFERLERRFRFPKLCTVVGMRRRYPGHKSYSLGKLCDYYEIALEDHHRALCDARATAQLLTLINSKRAQASAEERERATSAAA
jgi:DNA polymerase III subunit epsilon